MAVTGMQRPDFRTIGDSCRHHRLPAKAANGDPRILDLGLVASNIIALMLRAGTIVHGEQPPYHEQPEDRVERDALHRSIFRNGVYLGTLVGRDQNVVYTPDRFVGERLPSGIDRPEIYAISSEDDPSYATPTHPVARKTKPLDIALQPRRGWDSATESMLYPSAGRSHLCDLRRLRSDTVHVSHVGFHPDDPVKVAFLSIWMGSGGWLEYGEGASGLRSSTTGPARPFTRVEPRSPSLRGRPKTRSDATLQRHQRLSDGIRRSQRGRGIRRRGRRNRPFLPVSHRSGSLAASVFRFRQGFLSSAEPHRAGSSRGGSRSSGARSRSSCQPGRWRP